ncbi:MAG: ATP-binding cassette domain-containing protein, partial [Thermoguttaceae bacterium]|nr:ATP-binding cassette domain-containing protein [Thermoguttaceae bacterium]
MAEAIVDLQSVTFSYDGQAPALEDVSLKIAPGEFASIVGPNGGGKTTLVRLMLGLLHPQNGTVKLFGQQPEKTRLFVGYTPQQLRVDRLFPITVGDVVLD